MTKLKKWHLLKEEDISPAPWFPLFKHEVKLPDGKVVDDYYVSHLGDVSTVIAVTKEKKILMVRQYKHGLDDITIELPAGRIGKGRSKRDAAEAELLEETGYKAKEFIEIGGVCPVPSKDGSIMYGFIARGLRDTGETNFDETEEIELLKLSLEEIKGMIKEGEIIGSDAIALLTLAELKHPECF